VVIQTKQHLAILVPCGPALVLNLMRWGDEIRSWDELNLPPSSAKGAGVREGEMKMAKQLIDDMAGHWRADEYRDSFRDAIMKLVHTKAEAGETQDAVKLEEDPGERTGADVIDLTELLKRSLQGGTRRAQSAPPKATHKATRTTAPKEPAHREKATASAGTKRPARKGSTAKGKPAAKSSSRTRRAA
jgi:DNA end-binding protein Ku